jgi:hypothetical protein
MSGNTRGVAGNTEIRTPSSSTSRVQIFSNARLLEHMNESLLDCPAPRLTCCQKMTQDFRGVNSTLISPIIRQHVSGYGHLYCSKCNYHTLTPCFHIPEHLFRFGTRVPNILFLKFFFHNPFWQ